MKSLLGLLLVICSFSVTADELTEYFNDLKTLEAKFEQSVLNNTAEASPEQQSSGELIVKSPNQFYLEYTKPYKQVYVADGKKLISYDEDLEQVVIKEQGDLLVNTPAMLLGNPGDLAKLYTVIRTGEDGGAIWFELLPKKTDANFQSVSLAFSNKQLKSMEMRDNFGQTTRLIFTQVKKNVRVKKDQFHFTPPEGVDVIGQ